MKKLMKSLILLTIVYIASQQMVQGEIYKCITEKGFIEFTDQQCTNGTCEILNIEEHYTTDLPGLRPYELERLQQLEQNLRLDKLARLNDQQVLAGMTMNDEVQCRSALLHLDGLQYRLYSGQASYNSRFLQEHLLEQMLKREKYCR